MNLEAKCLADLTQIAEETFVSTGTRWWFRGQRDASWDLLPSVRRSYTKEDERRMANGFYTGAQSRHPNCPAADDFGAWLALMQHYGLPTRLLDWTHSLLTACYFATKYAFDMKTESSTSADAAIWLLDPLKLNVAQQYKPVYPPLDAVTVQPLVRPALKGGDTDKFEVLAVAPVESELKMLTQQGVFTVHVSDRPLNDMPGNENWLKKVVIPVASVADIAKELDLLSVGLSQVFPDLYHLATELKG